jgi:F-type H+-transporting ATPase subunit epsilon
METNTTFNFELVSPERKLLAEPAWQVTIPGEDGTFGVRAGHMSLVASIRTGVVEVVSAPGEAAQKIFITGGFADVTATNCTVLAEEAVNVADLDAAKLEHEISQLKEKLNVASDDVEKARLNRHLVTATAKLAVAQQSGKKAA